MAILAIDQGTSGTKALLVDENGAVAALGYRAVDLTYGAGGLVECDAEDLWRSLVDAVNVALDGNGLPLRAVGLANQGESILAWDLATGRALSPVMIWQDSRATYLCEERREYEEKIRSFTGLHLDPYFVAPKMRWLRDHVQKGGVLTTTDVWLNYRLTHRFVTDIATASRTLLLDIQDGEWSHELIDMWLLGDEKRPEILNNDVIVGDIFHPDLAAIKGVPLAGVIVDQPAALLAQSCLVPGEAKCTYGTGAFLLANIGTTPKISQHGLATSIAWDIHGQRTHYLDGQVFTAATAVQWLINNGLLRDASSIDGLGRDSGGVMSVSGFSGYGAPRWQPKGSASIAGISLATSKDHIARAVVDGIAAQVAELIEAMNSDGVPLKRLRVDGGLSQSHTLMQMQSDLSQLPIDVYPHPDATALGVAALASLSIDPSLSLPQAIPSWRSETTYEPEWSADQAHDYLDRWKRLADRVEVQLHG